MCHFLYSIQVCLHRLESSINLCSQNTCSFFNVLYTEFFLALCAFYKFLLTSCSENLSYNFLHYCCWLFHTKRYDVPKWFIDCVNLFWQGNSAKDKRNLEIIDHILLACWKESCHKICTHMNLFNVVDEKVNFMQMISYWWP